MEPEQDIGQKPELYGVLATCLRRPFIFIFTLSIFYTALLIVYRLKFSPIATFPGPLIAAITGWYEFYYDVVKHGQFLYQIEKLHDKYGPIVRVNPWELSIRDPDFYRSIYVCAPVRRTNMYWRHRSSIGFNGSMLSAESHELHRLRRRPLETFFSRQGILRIEPMLSDQCKLLTERLEVFRGTHKTIQMDHVYASFVTDLISKMSFGEPRGLLLEPEFSPKWSAALENATRKATLGLHLPWLVGITQHIPYSLLLLLAPGAAHLKHFIDYGAKLVEEESQRLSEEKENTKIRASILSHLLHSDLPSSEKSTDRLQGELNGVLAAGTLTTTRTLCTLTYYILANKNIERQLRDELHLATGSSPVATPSWIELEKLPYMQACIKEGLRISMPLIRRIPRCAPDVAISYKQWVIPENTPVGSAVYSMHMDASVFPEPFEFKPERWLGDYDPLMDRNFVPFSKGSRACPGMNLVFAELSLLLATLFCPGSPEMRLFNTDESDVKPVVDSILGMPKPEGNGLRVTLH